MERNFLKAVEKADNKFFDIIEKEKNLFFTKQISRARICFS